MYNVNFCAGNNIVSEVVPKAKKVASEISHEMKSFPDLVKEQQQKEVTGLVKQVENPYLSGEQLCDAMTKKANDALAIKAAEEAYGKTPSVPWN